ncbi:hypothetical protein BBJ28_00018138 [Nothophytophthora sp. Chile5]|nr:hypothetical protein BBJ28_00018138 [Nothophytophthora sp. Chile5]
MMENDMSYDRVLEFNPHGSKAGDVRKRIPKIIGTDGAEREPFLLASWKICAFSKAAYGTYADYLKRIADTVKEFDLIAIQVAVDRKIKYIGDIRYDSIITQIEILQRSSSVTKERGEEIGDEAKQDCAEEDIPKVTPFPEVAAVEKQQETPKEISNSATAETHIEYFGAEVRHEEVLDALIDPYLPGWGYVHSWPSNQSGYIEYLAFMYRLDAVEVVAPGPYFDDEAGVFSRRPIACTFRAKEENMQKLELTLVNVHLPAKWKDALEEVAGFEQALAQLAREMTNNGKLCVLGDFNLSPLEAELGKQMAALIYPLQTTIFGSRYDEIWLDKNDFTASSAQGNPRSSRYLIYSGVLRIDEIHYRDKNRTMVTRAMEQTFKNEVSDHLPVWAAFRAVQ